MTDTIEQAEELLCERVYPETAAHHNERVAQCLARLVDELKESNRQLGHMTTAASAEADYADEMRRQRDELRDSLMTGRDLLEESRNKQQYDFIPRADSWMRKTEQALKETS